MSCKTALVLGVLFVSGGILSANELGDWPRFRGVQFNGISPEKEWTSTWPEGGPTKLWEAQIGTGFASVSIAKDRLFTLGRQGDDDVIYGLNAATGKEQWRHAYACKLVDNLHEGGPAATPTVADGRVYTVSKEGHVFCLDAADGRVVWKQELQSLADVKMPDWGFAGSVLIHNNLAIIEAGRLVALNLKSGEVVWKTEKYRAGYGSPVPWKIDGKDYIATMNNDQVLIVQASDGAEVAKTKWETNFATTACTPILHRDTLFVSTGYGRGCALFRLKEGRLTKVYENKNMRNHMANCVLVDGHLYGIDGNSHDRSRCNLVCMKYDDGEVAWKENGFGCGSVLVAGGKLIILSDEGELSVAETSPVGYKPLAKAKVIGGKCWTTPVLAGGKIYCRNAAGDLVCLDVKK